MAAAPGRLGTVLLAHVPFITYIYCHGQACIHVGTSLPFYGNAGEGFSPHTPGGEGVFPHNHNTWGLRPVCSWQVSVCFTHTFFLVLLQKCFVSLFQRINAVKFNSDASLIVTGKGAGVAVALRVLL